MQVVVVRHHDVDSAGLIGTAFETKGAELDVRLFPDGGPLPGASGVDHVVVLGAIPSLNDDLAWIAEELTWLRQMDRAGVPILGICFGAQALCAALGGRVERAPRKEIGWVMVDSADPDLVPPGPWLEFHGDRCILPRTARVLAANELCVQAFTIGRHLGVQFHPEIDGAQLKRWLDDGCAAEAARAGIDPEELLTQTIREEPQALSRAEALITTALSQAHSR
jgi:GMP synthase-like glutamine amidotransferase